MDNKKTCDELIGSEMESRFNDFENMTGIIELSDLESLEPERIKELKTFIEDQGYDPSEYITEDDLQELSQTIQSEYGLGAFKYDLIRIELSYGGPQDYLELRIDKEDKTLVSGTYHYLDWFDGAIRSLNQDQLGVIEALYSYLWECD